MPLKKRKPAKERSVEPEKDVDKDPKKKKPSLESGPTSGARSERDTGPAGSSPVGASFPIVGIGASAGGLEALETFFENLPEESGLAFVVITHTDPSHTSLLPEILTRRTKTVAVKQIEEAMPVEPNCVYLPPSDRDPFIGDETLHLRARPARHEAHMPVDLFLKNLSEVRGEHAGGVILSGTGSDGTYGLRAIKEKSGIVLVQEPASARHTGMPASAIDTGLVDFVITPAEMAGQLIEYFRHPVEIKAAPEKKNKKAPDLVKKIMALLTNRTRHDFNLYKDGTLTRRIARRIAVTRSRNASEYLQTLYRDEGEVRALFQDLLIGVTSFFRDPEAFAHLKERAFPELFSKKREGEALRVWIPGCSSGEEAYSVAIILKEYMEENDVSKEMQIFGTDIDPLAIAKARTGTYLRNIAADVNAARLKRFFDKDGDRYRVRREIRESVVFAEQNLLRDPPFSNLDLLVCRNLLIYLKSEAQQRLVPLFFTLSKNTASSSWEELRSTNEEMQSANEELQSMNEELESSREELQSLNEELNTVNSELQVKIRELHDSYRAITDALDSTRIAMIFLDKELRVVRFTNAVTRLINLIESDVGRPLEHISDNLDAEDLTAKAAQVLKSLTPFESEVKTEAGHWYRMNIMVHRREEHFIEGIVLTFADIDVQKRAQQEIEEMRSREVQSARRFTESIVETVAEALLVLDEQMRVVTANRRFYERFDTDREEIEGKSLFELGNGQWNIPELRRLL